MRRDNSIAQFCVVVLLVIGSTACAASSPEQTNDGWQTGSPASVGLDGAALAEAVDLVHDGTYENIHSILIVKDDKLVFEEYFSGYLWDFDGEDFNGAFTEFDRDSLHNQASVTKSFTSTLIGIAIDQGFIRDVDQLLFDFFPEYASLRNDSNDDITLDHLLTMTAGFEWNGIDVPLKSLDPPNDGLNLFLVEDPLEYVLSKPIVAAPGTTWYYNGGETVLLGEIIRRTSGLRMDEFAARYLFSPLGITEHEWLFINPEIVFAAGNLRVRPRDMAKLGVLFLNGGVWHGERVVSEAWISKSTEAHSSTFWPAHYGYQWWRNTYRSESASFDAIYADGWGGQRIMVFPELDMVVVFTGGNYAQQHPIDEILERHIFPALER
jgi:CubicO group peptidase (beta-lactamase class C family)